MNKSSVLIFSDLMHLSRYAAEQLAVLGCATLAMRRRFVIALSGGGTPQTMYHLLAQPPYVSAEFWAQTHLFWGDERLVAPDAPGSNYGQLKQLLLDQINMPESNIHPVRGALEPEKAAADYAERVRQFAPRFDLALLGMGEDGHTASLFPGPISDAEREQPVMAISAEYQGRPASRVTLTPLIFNQARQIFILVSGAEKADTLAQVLEGKYDPERWPVQRIRPKNGRLHWLIDRAAAKYLTQGE